MAGIPNRQGSALQGRRQRIGLSPEVTLLAGYAKGQPVRRGHLIYLLSLIFNRIILKTMNIFKKVLFAFMLLSLMASSFVVQAEEISPITSVTCSVSKTNLVNQDVTWTVQVVGGSGSYTSVSFQADGWSEDTGSSLSLTKQFTQPSTQSVSVNVMDNVGNSGNTTCPEANIYGILKLNSCNTSISTAVIGQNVTWTSSVEGGMEPYTIIWSGTDIDSTKENGINLVKNYTTAGSKSAKIETIMSADGQSNDPNMSCGESVNIIENVTYPELSVACNVSDSSIKTGDSVNWSVNISGGRAPYQSNITWTGSDSLSGNSKTIAKSYSVVGTKTGHVSGTVMSDDGQSKELDLDCGPVTVTRAFSGGGGSSSSGSISSTTTSNSTSNSTTTNNSGIVAGINNEGGLNEELLLGNGNTLPLLVKEDVKAGDKSTTTATSTASTSENILEGQTAGLSSLFFANGNFSWVSLLVLALIILGLLFVIWFFLIRKKGDEENKTPEVK